MMTHTLYETHVHTKNLDVAVEFYKKIGLDLAHYIEERRVAFFWFNKEKKKEQMLGVWEVSDENFKTSHFAFKVSYDEIVKSREWLLEREIQPRSSFGLEPLEPIVHTWMPAATMYFSDPDGNSLEFLCILREGPKPDKNVMYLSEWETLVTNGN